MTKNLYLFQNSSRIKCNFSTTLLIFLKMINVLLFYKSLLNNFIETNYLIFLETLCMVLGYIKLFITLILIKI